MISVTVTIFWRKRRRSILDVKQDFFCRHFTTAEVQRDSRARVHGLNPVDAGLKLDATRTDFDPIVVSRLERVLLRTSAIPTPGTGDFYTAEIIIAVPPTLVAGNRGRPELLQRILDRQLVGGQIGALIETRIIDAAGHAQFGGHKHVAIAADCEWWPGAFSSG